MNDVSNHEEGTPSTHTGTWTDVRTNMHSVAKVNIPSLATI